MLSINFCQLSHNAVRIFMIPATTTTTQRQTENDAWKIFLIRTSERISIFDNHIILVTCEVMRISIRWQKFMYMHSFHSRIRFFSLRRLCSLFACLLIVYTIRPLDLLYFSIQFNFRFIFCWFIFLSLFLSACLCFFPRKRWNYDDGGGGNGSSYFLFPFAFLSLIRKRNIFQQEYAYKYILVCLIADLNAQL